MEVILDMKDLTLSVSETVKIKQNQQVLEMTAVQWKCFVDAIPLLQAWFMMKKEDPTFAINNLHIVAQICADTSPLDDTMWLKNKENTIILNEDHLKALLDVDNFIFTNVKPCYAKLEHKYKECIDCNPKNKMALEMGIA